MTGGCRVRRREEAGLRKRLVERLVNAPVDTTLNLDPLTAALLDQAFARPGDEGIG